MADDFKALVALTKQTNAKLELLHKQGEEDDSPRERLLDALPEILTAKDISKKETDQKDKLHREEVKKNKDNLEELKKADAERSKESTKNSQSIKQQNQMIVSEGHKDTAMIVDSLGNVEKSQSINEKIQLRLNEKPEGAAQEEQEQKTESFFKKLTKSIIPPINPTLNNLLKRLLPPLSIPPDILSRKPNFLLVASPTLINFSKKLFCLLLSSSSAEPAGSSFNLNWIFSFIL